MRVYVTNPAGEVLAVSFGVPVIDVDRPWHWKPNRIMHLRKVALKHILEHESKGWSRERATDMVLGDGAFRAMADHNLSLSQYLDVLLAAYLRWEETLTTHSEPAAHGKSDKRDAVEVGWNKRKFDHSANFAKVEKDGVTIGARDKKGELVAIAAERKEGRELARSEGREDLIPPSLRGMPLAAKVALGLVGGAGVVLLGAAVVRKVRGRGRR